MHHVPISFVRGLQNFFFMRGAKAFIARACTPNSTRNTSPIWGFYDKPTLVGERNPSASCGYAFTHVFKDTWQCNCSPAGTAISSRLWTCLGLLFAMVRHLHLAWSEAGERQRLLRVWTKLWTRIRTAAFRMGKWSISVMWKLITYLQSGVVCCTQLVIFHNMLVHRLFWSALYPTPKPFVATWKPPLP